MRCHDTASYALTKLCCRPAQPRSGVTVTRNLSWSLDAACGLAPALSPDTEDAAARVSPQPWGLYSHGAAVGAC
jgi:hypothetical protein